MCEKEYGCHESTAKGTAGLVATRADLPQPRDTKAEPSQQAATRADLPQPNGNEAEPSQQASTRGADL